MPKYIITSDLHLTDRPQDEYRWALLPWLVEQVRRHRAQRILILGDLTDSKDRHSAPFVNRVMERMAGVSEEVPVTVLKGNHDYLDPNNPFFKFLNFLEHVEFVSKPAWSHKGILLLPHTKDPDTEWFPVSNMMEDRVVLMHQTVRGAKASNGVELDGIPPERFEVCETVISGDIHVPQQVGKVTYCGSPYHVHFGDAFRPRVLLYDNGELQDLHFKTISRRVVTVRKPEKIKKQELNKGDQIKVKLKLGRSEFVDWQAHKRRVVEICEELGVELFGVQLVENKRRLVGQETDPKPTYIKSRDPQEVLTRYCEKEDVPEYTARYGHDLCNLES